MPQETIGDLDAASSVAATDILEIESDPGGTPASEKATVTQILANAPGAAGGTDVAVADGGTGASTAAGARTNLGLVIGTDVQAHSAVLDATTASFTTADETKLDAIEALADVTDETNVTAALDGATLTAVTVATGDKVIVQDVSDTDNIKTVTAQSIADLASGGDGAGLTAALDNTRLSSGARSLHLVFTNDGVSAQGTDANSYKGGLVYCPAQTISTISVECTTGATSALCYVVLANVDADDGLPGTIAHTFGTFDVATTGTKTLTGLSESVSAGWYWLLMKFDTTSAQIRCFSNTSQPGLFISTVATGDVRTGLSSSTTQVGAPSDLSAVNWAHGGQFAIAPKVTVT